MGYVYLWRMGVTSYHKVGSTFDVRMRLKIAATDLPEDLVPLRYAVVEQHKKVENAIHEAMRTLRYHLRKEWYYGDSHELILIFNRVVKQHAATPITVDSIAALPERPRKRKIQKPSGRGCPKGHPLGERDHVGCYCPVCAREHFRYKGMHIAGQFANRHYLED